MKPEESVVNLFLNQTQKGKIVYEPDGNIPPDFSIDGQIGVEVRRLNQNFRTKNSYEGLEQVSSPLESAIEEVLLSFDSQYRGKSFWVNFDYERPVKLNQIKALKEKLRDQVQEFLDQNFQPPRVLQVSENIIFEIQTRLPTNGKTFRRAVSIDDNSGGPVIHEYIENVNLCILEKNEKIGPYKPKYQEWWLTLVDKTVLYPDEADLKEIKQNIIDLRSFTRLCIINPNDLGLVVDIRK